ncbi:hypothetical protein [Endozoicomonas sp.]|uniref:hypothetical protein n=1 Tax=Endozoicomonas sp. TaxID=1892382 RepID=UPI00288489E0|nr:hypothetical protein [Endozoicomonas sp.]
MEISQSIRGKSSTRLSREWEPEPPAKKRRIGIHTISLCEPQNMAADLAELRRLKIAPSRIDAQKGAGEGVFTTSDRDFCKSGKNTIFDKNEIILRKVTGITAYRQRQTTKWLEWLHYDKTCMPLTDDSNIIWSRYFIGTDGTVEIGVLPDGIAININDSPEPNCEVRATVEDENLKTSTGNKLTTFSHDKMPVMFEVVALKEINPETELLWCYEPDNKHLKSMTSSVDYKSKYLKRKHTPGDRKKIIKIMGEVFTEPVTVSIMNKFNTIIEQRLINEAKVAVSLSFNSEEEKHYNNLKMKSQQKVSLVLKEAKNNQSALNAYIKYKINNSKDLCASLILICSRLKENEISIPNHHAFTNNKHSAKEFDTYNLFDYCYEQRFLDQDMVAISAPFEWLGERISKDDSSWLVTLRKRLRLILLKGQSIPHCLIELNKHIPNPLNGYKKCWLIRDIENFAGIHTLEQSMLKEAINSYLKEPKNSVCFNESKKSVFRAARSYNNNAHKAIIARHCQNKITLKKIASHFNRASILFYLNNEYVTPTGDRTREFIKANFTRSEQKEMLGFSIYTNHQLLQAFKDKPPRETTGSINWELCRRIRDSHDNNFLKSFISIKSKHVKSLSDLVQLLKKTKIQYWGTGGCKEDCTAENLTRLLENENEASVRKLFKHRQTDKELLTNIEKKNTQHDKIEILTRAKTNPELVTPYVVTVWKKSRRPLIPFCLSTASLLTRYGISAPESSQRWTKDHIVEIISKVEKDSAPREYGKNSGERKKTTDSYSQLLAPKGDELVKALVD